ncbi:MAG TPA: biotin--[acetyl-CoA-carboxylase] ligase [Nitrospiraceae bacterium]|nr:biotin--[acetyl-CoA-carboxylase] ligase [Nitrospiraceae bacterium]
MSSSVSAFQPLTPQAITMALCTKILGRYLHMLEETPSTNSAAMSLAQNGEPDGTIVVADAQTSGRGRLGRHWHSPPGKNLYCSIILRRPMPPDQVSRWLSWVPLLSAVAVSRAVQVISGLRPSLKWPNDVLIEQRKIGGLLCESSGMGTATSFVIVGIGLNVNMWRDAFPTDLHDVATSLAAEAGRPFDRAVLLAALLSELEFRYEAFFSGLTDIKQEYELRCTTIGQRVRVKMTNGQCGDGIEGQAVSIGDDGSLQVMVDDPQDPLRRTPVAIRAGDVVHLRRESN